MPKSTIELLKKLLKTNFENSTVEFGQIGKIDGRFFIFPLKNFEHNETLWHVLGVFHDTYATCPTVNELTLTMFNNFQTQFVPKTRQLRGHFSTKVNITFTKTLRNTIITKS